MVVTNEPELITIPSSNVIVPFAASATSLLRNDVASKPSTVSASPTVVAEKSSTRFKSLTNILVDASMVDHFNTTTDAQTAVIVGAYSNVMVCQLALNG